MDDRTRNEEQLTSWKEIGAYIGRNDATARRWEKDEGLPVHRHSHKSRASVYAYPSEIDAWRATRRLAAEQPPVPKSRRFALTQSLAFGVTIVLCLIMVGNGVRPQIASAQDTGLARQIGTVGAADYPRLALPGGRFLSYRDPSNGGLMVQDLASHTTRRLTALVPNYFAGPAAISQDGRWIAYSWSGGTPEKADLRILPLDADESTQPRLLRTGENASLAPVAWTNDGKYLLAVRQYTPDRSLQLARVSTQDGSVQVLKSINWGWPDSRLSPDGRFLAYDQQTGSDGKGAHGIFVLAVDGSSEAALTNHPSNDSHPVWSADGKRVLFLRSENRRQSLWAIAVVNGKPAGPEMLIRENERGVPLGVTRDDTLYTIVWGGIRRNIYTAELAPGQNVSGPPVLLSPRAGDYNAGPAWSPDGTKLAFYSRGGGQQTRVVIRDISTGVEHPIALDIPVPAPYGDTPVWFPDGRSVLVVSLSQTRPNGVGYYRIDLESGKTQLIHRPVGWGPIVFQPAISPDGKSLYYLDADGPSTDRRIMRFDLATQKDTVLKTVPAPGFRALALSPDGSQLAYSVLNAAEDAETLAVMPASGGEPRVLRRGILAATRANIALSWTPDGRSLMFVAPEKDRKDPQTLWRIPVAGGPAENMGVSRNVIRAPGINPSGRQLTFEADDDAPNELWTLDMSTHAGKP